MTAYYNEIDPFAAAWLRELIKRGLIADGVVDERSITDVAPEDVREFTQCHYFAGIGGWSYALRLAGWPDDRSLWTGSCPCQPFSTAGKRKGVVDERHLWPEFYRLIKACRPVAIIGEQVASRDGLAWFDLVQTGMEGAGYACGAVDTCAAGFGAPHIRQRLYWVAHARHGEYQRRHTVGNPVCTNDGAPSPLCIAWPEREWSGHDIANGGTSNRLGNSDGEGLEGYSGYVHGEAGREDAAGSAAEAGELGGASPTNGFWRDADWLWGKDKKWRPIKPGATPLVDGIPVGVGRGRDFRAISQRIKGYGNAIVAPQAAEIIKAFMEVVDENRYASPCSEWWHRSHFSSMPL